MAHRVPSTSGTRASAPLAGRLVPGPAGAIEDDDKEEEEEKEEEGHS